MTAGRASDSSPTGDRPPRSPWEGPPTSITVDFANLPNEPSFPAAESAVLGAVMLSPSCAAKLLPLLQPAHFTSAPHRDTLAAIHTLWQQQHPIDPVLVHDQLRKDGHVTWGDQQAALFVDDCINAAYFPGNGASYAATVLEYATRRRAVQAGVRIAQAAARGAGDIDQLATIVAAEVNAVADRAAECSARAVTVRSPVPVAATIAALQGEGLGARASHPSPAHDVDL